MTILTKAVRLAHRAPDGAYEHGDDGEVRTRLVLDPETVADMGNPDTITVTVEPGDAMGNQPLC